MPRVAMLLSLLGLMTVGLAAVPAPAQAQEGWWGYSHWRQHEWREHEWRRHHRSWYPWHYRYSYYTPYAYYYTPGVTFGFTAR